MLGRAGLGMACHQLLQLVIAAQHAIEAVVEVHDSSCFLKCSVASPSSAPSGDSNNRRIASSSSAARAGSAATLRHSASEGPCSSLLTSRRVVAPASPRSKERRVGQECVSTV